MKNFAVIHVFPEIGQVLITNIYSGDTQGNEVSIQFETEIANIKMVLTSTTENAADELFEKLSVDPECALEIVENIKSKMP